MGRFRPRRCPRAGQSARMLSSKRVARRHGALGIDRSEESGVQSASRQKKWGWGPPHRGLQWSLERHYAQVRWTRNFSDRAFARVPGNTDGGPSSSVAIPHGRVNVVNAAQRLLSATSPTLRARVTGRRLRLDRGFKVYRRAVSSRSTGSRSVERVRLPDRDELPDLEEEFPDSEIPISGIGQRGRASVQ